MQLDLVLPLNVDHRDALVEHFMRLPKEDLRLRFGHTLSLPAIEAYVHDIDFARDGVFGVIDENLQIAGTAHVALLAECAEFGVSVLPSHRRRGIGRALFNRAVMFARNLQVDSLFVHCLAENQPMLALAHSAGMSVVREAGEADAWLELASGGPHTLTAAYISDRFAVFDYALKAQLASARRIAEAFSDSGAALAVAPPEAAVSDEPK